jgi:hypothetical protein
LKRFSYDVKSWRRFKIEGVFQFPLALEVGGRLYRLTGVVIHKGCAESGHYYSHIRVSDGWMCFDDRNVHSVTEAFVLEDGANYGYILFYQIDKAPEVKLTIAKALREEAQIANASLHKRRILCSRGFGVIMEHWSTKESPRLIKLVLVYVFSIAPFCANTAAAPVCAKNLHGRLSEEHGRSLIGFLATNPMILCPADEVRQAACDLALELYRLGRGARALKWIFDNIDVWWNSKSDGLEFLGLIGQILKAFEDARKTFAEGGSLKKLEGFLVEDFRRKSEEKKRAKASEWEVYHELDYSVWFGIFLLFPSDNLRAFCTDGDWVIKIVLSATPSAVVVALLKSFGDRPEIVARLQTFAAKAAKVPRFKQLVDALAAK